MTVNKNTTKLMLTAAYITVLLHWLTELQFLHKLNLERVHICMYI
jgi:hypothetical protein